MYKNLVLVLGAAVVQYHFWMPHWPVKVTQSCSTLCNPMDCIVHGILQAWILEWGAFPSSRWSSQLRDQTQVSHIAGRFFTSWATREADLDQHILCFTVFFAEFSWNDFFLFFFWNRQGSRLWVWPRSSQSSLTKVILLKRGEAQSSLKQPVQEHVYCPVLEKSCSHCEGVFMPCLLLRIRTGEFPRLCLGLPNSKALPDFPKHKDKNRTSRDQLQGSDSSSLLFTPFFSFQVTGPHFSSPHHPWGQEDQKPQHSYLLGFYHHQNPC